MPARAATSADLGACQWFALCDHPADGLVAHPVLDYVPTCTRCATRLALDLIPLADILIEETS